MPKWTKEQMKAINSDGTNIIVSAGAGSGKTAVLTERVIRKLEDGIGIDKLLILTFTKAAAREMKTRIASTTYATILLTKREVFPVSCPTISVDPVIIPSSFSFSFLWNHPYRT